MLLDPARKPKEKGTMITVLLVGPGKHHSMMFYIERPWWGLGSKDLTSILRLPFSPSAVFELLLEFVALRALGPDL